MIYGIVLAGGSGKRFGSEIPKQYIEVNGKPLLYYTLKAFEDSGTDKVIVVSGTAWMKFVIDEIVDRYRLKKVIRVCQGGEERFDSVHHGLDDLHDLADESDVVLIHDGARPFIKPEEINAMAEAASAYGAAIAAMPVKDTIKISDDEGFVAATTIRSNTWQIQTPQAFRYGLIKEAYETASQMQWKDPAANLNQTSGQSKQNAAAGQQINTDQQIGTSQQQLQTAGKIFTDDSMVLEAIYPEQKIKLVPLSYENIKITTPDDLEVAKARLK